MATNTNGEIEKERVLKAQSAVRQKVAAELLQTEQNYVKSIEAVDVGLVSPIRSALGKAAAILSKDEYRAIFANLDELYKLHLGLLASFEERIEKNWSDTSTVGDIFLKQMAVFTQYRDYLVNYNISIVVLQSSKNGNTRFKQLVNVRAPFGPSSGRETQGET